MPLRQIYGRTLKPVNIPTYILAQATTSGTSTQTLRPAEGQLLRLTFASVRLDSAPSFAAGDNVRCLITLFDGTTRVTLDEDIMRQGDGQNYENVFARIGEGSHGIILLTNTRYLELQGIVSSAGSSATFDFMAVAEAI